MKKDLHNLLCCFKTIFLNCSQATHSGFGTSTLGPTGTSTWRWTGTISAPVSEREELRSSSFLFLLVRWHWKRNMGYADTCKYYTLYAPALATAPDSYPHTRSHSDSHPHPRPHPHPYLHPQPTFAAAAAAAAALALALTSEPAHEPTLVPATYHTQISVKIEYVMVFWFGLWALFAWNLKSNYFCLMIMRQNEANLKDSLTTSCLFVLYKQ